MLSFKLARFPAITLGLGVAIWLSTSSMSLASVYNKTSSGLTEFPHNISDDVIVIDLALNSITTVDYVETLPNLVNLSLRYNDLAQFPDLSNVSSTLEGLNLAHHKMVAIPPERLNHLVRLRTLEVGFGPLTAVPDVAGPSGTLYHLGVEHTAISGFPEVPVLGRSFWSMYVYGNAGITGLDIRQLELYPKLEILYIHQTGVTSIPNLCEISRTRVIRINLTGMVLKCDTEILWLVVAMATGHVMFDGSPPKCSSDGGATVTEWNDLDIKALQGANKEHVQQFYEVLDDPSHFHCNPTVLAATPGESLTSCATRCLSSEECVLFNKKQNGECRLTSLRPGDPLIFRDNFPWFGID